MKNLMSSSANRIYQQTSETLNFIIISIFVFTLKGQKEDFLGRFWRIKQIKPAFFSHLVNCSVCTSLPWFFWNVRERNDNEFPTL